MTEPAGQERFLDDCVRPECLDRISAAWYELCNDAGDVTDLDRMMFEIAIIELAGNVVQHGSSESDLKCRITIRISSVALEAEICDTGDRVDVDIAGSALPGELAERGRGLPMARATVDELTYHRVGDLNCWRISRDRTG